MVTKRIIVGLLVLAVPACAAGCAEDAEAGQDAPSGDARETRGAEVPAAADPASAERAPLLSWSFEPASADCNGWPALGADAIRASPARSGAYSCKVCSDGSAADLGLVHDLGAASAGRYVLTAWVRKRAENAAPAEASARIDAATEGGVAVRAVAPAVAVREAWDRLEATLELEADATNVRVTVAAPVIEAGRCLFVDDVELRRRP